MWEVYKSQTRSNFLRQDDALVPLLSLRNKDAKIEISCCPCRIIYEPCIPDDNNCLVTIYFKDGLSDSFLKLMSKFNIRIDTSKQTLSTIFSMDGSEKNELAMLFNVTQQYLIKEVKSSPTQVIMGLNELRRFCKISPDNSLPITSSQSFFNNKRVRKINDLEKEYSDTAMAQSAFGQGSFTAHRLGFTPLKRRNE